MNNLYKYAGEPFTAQIAAELILELCKGETLKKEKIRDRVYEYHEKQGGEKYEGSRTLNQCFNDALNKDLKQKRGLADNKKRGYWTIFGEPPINGAPEELPESCVYIYYYPSYRELAKFKGKDTYPCKIGRTGRGAEKRIKEQQTGMPEHAKTEVVMPTDDPLGLEQMIRSYLKRKGMYIQDAPGDEWYLINSEIAKKVAKAFEDFQKTLDGVI